MPLQKGQLNTDLAVVEGELPSGEWEPIAYIGPERSGGLLLVDPEDYGELRVRFLAASSLQAPEHAEGLVREALGQCIKEHGPITSQAIGMAAARIVSSLAGGRKPLGIAGNDFPVVTGPAE